jgi:DNA-binding CsgD family transcriptional regulator
LPGVLSYLADAAFACRHQGIARLVLPLLGPYSGLLVYVPGLICYGAADRYLGRLHSTLGDNEAALGAFEAALELDQRTGWTTWIAHSQYALGSHLVTMSRQLDGARIRGLLDGARATAVSLGMVALEGRIEALLGRRPAGVAEMPGSLTPREHEVLDLLAEGRSNRQIGEELHASQHTIANHVRAILAKTGTSNRTEAASWAHRHGWP